MPCGCQKQSNNPQQFVYIEAGGRKTIFNSEIQAKAAQVRAGGGGTVKPR